MTKYSLLDGASVVMFDRDGEFADCLIEGSSRLSTIKDSNPEPVHYLLKLKTDVDGVFIHYFNKQPDIRVYLHSITDKPNWLVVEGNEESEAILKCIDFVDEVVKVRVEIS